MGRQNQTVVQVQKHDYVGFLEGFFCLQVHAGGDNIWNIIRQAKQTSIVCGVYVFVRRV